MFMGDCIDAGSCRLVLHGSTLLCHHSSIPGGVDKAQPVLSSFLFNVFTWNDQVDGLISLPCHDCSVIHYRVNRGSHAELALSPDT